MLYMVSSQLMIVFSAENENQPDTPVKKIKKYILIQQSSFHLSKQRD